MNNSHTIDKRPENMLRIGQIRRHNHTIPCRKVQVLGFSISLASMYCLCSARIDKDNATLKSWNAREALDANTSVSQKTGFNYEAKLDGNPERTTDTNPGILYFLLAIPCHLTAGHVMHGCVWISRAPPHMGGFKLLTTPAGNPRRSCRNCLQIDRNVELFRPLAIPRIQTHHGRAPNQCNWFCITQMNGPTEIHTPTCLVCLDDDKDNDRYDPPFTQKRVNIVNAIPLRFRYGGDLDGI